MIVCNTNGAVVIVDRVFMVMRNCHEGGKQEQDYKKSCKAEVSGHDASSTHE
jgi:hypothetical protein